MALRFFVRLRVVCTAALLSLIFLALSAHPASAHARPAMSTPSPNQNLNAAPTTVTIQFSQRVKPDGSDIIVYDKFGKTVSAGPATVDSTDPKTMSVTMAGDDSVAYLVVWHTISLDDGAVAIGAFNFGVNATAKDMGMQMGSVMPSTVAQGYPALDAVLGVMCAGIGATGCYVVMRRRRVAW